MGLFICFQPSDERWAIWSCKLLRWGPCISHRNTVSSIAAAVKEFKRLSQLCHTLASLTRVLLCSVPEHKHATPVVPFCFLNTFDFGCIILRWAYCACNLPRLGLSLAHRAAISARLDGGGIGRTLVFATIGHTPASTTARTCMLFQNTKTSLWLFFFLRPKKLRFVLWFQMNSFFVPQAIHWNRRRFLNLVCCFCRRRLGSSCQTNSILSCVKVFLRDFRRVLFCSQSQSLKSQKIPKPCLLLLSQETWFFFLPNQFCFKLWNSCSEPYL